MKRLLLFIGIVSIIVLTTDILLGFCCRYYINHHRLMGEFGEIDYIVNNNNNTVNGVETEKKLKHSGILGMKWGIRRYQNPDGTLTSAGKEPF